MADKYIINEEGQVCEKFTLEACEELLRCYGYTIEEVEEEYDEDKEARDYEGGKEDYLYDNYVAEQLEERDK